MRRVECINKDWFFRYGEEIDINSSDIKEKKSTLLDLPYTYNGLDGQNGGANYYKGKAVFSKEIQKPQLYDTDRIYLEFNGVNSVCEVYANGKKLAEHKGGYSIFRVDISDSFDENNLCVLSVLVDNSIVSDVYPQVADFTFYGGIYRDVYLIIVPNTRFCMDYYGSEAVKATSVIHDDYAVIDFEAYVENAEVSDMLEFSVYEDEKCETLISQVYIPADKISKASAKIYKPHLWQGIQDPFLYNIQVKLIRHNEVLDERNITHGIREFSVDPDRGFILNGVVTALRGVSRHQDRLGIGNALSFKEHFEDALLMREMGVNTIRLAHYQQDHMIYDICDRLGFVVWAEIPFISVMNADKKAHDNAMLQMKELIYQNYNHTSICFWGIANEITIGGDKEGLYENLLELDKLAHELDPGRMTAIAQVSMLPKESNHNQITDVFSYNIYYGWYGGVFEDNEQFLDSVHELYPNRPIGISEYGCEGIISWHSDKPEVRDYTEEYQCLYHEHMLKIISERDYLWATHVWNMFDFGCDTRDEGGVKGRNNKGLISLDRKIKKDAFFLYKAYWSNDSFVHITGRRYALRHQEKINIKVYSNMSKIDLYVNGKLAGTKTGEKIFIFDDIVLSNGANYISAVGDEKNFDSITLTKVDKKFEAYVMPPEEDEEREGVKNWFEDIDINEEVKECGFKEGYFSIKSKLGDIMENDEAFAVLSGFMSKFGKMKVKKTALAMMSSLSIEEMSGILSQDKENKDKIFAMLNAKLQEIENK